MKGLVITLLGIALFAGGLMHIKNDFYGYTCCFLGGALIGTGISKTISGK
jgi:hypothetical protein